jgi:hypothetical protein
VAATRPEGRKARARAAALEMHSRGLTNTVKAREAFNRRFEKLVDPDGVLAPEIRARRAEQAKKAHFIRLAAASAKARGARSS